MAARLEAVDLANEDISQRPEVFDLDPFVIVPAAAVAAAALAQFPVEVTLAPPGPGAEILDSARKVVANTGPGVPVWNTQLPLGLFELVVPGQPSYIFKVSGALGPTGHPEVVHVP